jgi:thiol-disulfide isomerase/thioredoxin
MKKYIFITLILFGLNSAEGQNFNLDSIKNVTRNDTITFIYMTALWCSPCLEKMPYLDGYFSATNKPYKLMYLFDREGYSGEKLIKIFPFIDFRNKAVFLPLNYYSNGAFQFNSHKKLFKKFINDNKFASPAIKNIEQFNLSSILAIDSKGNGLIFEAPDTKNLTLKEIDELFSSLIKSL